MHEFGVSLGLGKMVCMVSRVKQSIWKGFRSMKLDLESFGLRLKIWLWKGEREDDEMNRGNRRICTYFTTPRIYPRNPSRNKKQRTRHSKEFTQEIKEQERTLKKEKFEKYY